MSTEKEITLSYNKYIITLKPLSRGFVSMFLTNTLRGGFGYLLKKTVCIRTNKKCEDCLLNNSCPYIYIFETHPPPNSQVLKNISSICHPFIFYTPFQYGDKIDITNPQENINLELTIFGNAISYFPYFIYALICLGEKGIGKDKIKYIIEKIQLINNNRIIYDHNRGEKITRVEPEKLIIPSSYETAGKTEVRIDLLSPLRIQKKSTIQGKPDPQTFVKTLLRRIYNIALFHCGIDLNWDYHHLIKLAENTEILENNTEVIWPDRYSTRQNSRINLKGIIGNFTLNKFPSSLIPLLKAGEIMHLGKNTSFGFGRYCMETS